MNNETRIGIKFDNKVTNEKKLEKYAETLQKINTFVSAIDTQKVSNINSYANNTKQIKEDIKDTSNSSKQLSINLNNAFSIAKISVYLKAFERLLTNLSKYTKKSAEFLENWNLLDVAFQNNTVEAEKLVNKLSEMYGLDESWGYRTVGLFKQLSNAMGLTDEVGTKLSKTLTQLAIDTSSLYNIDVEDTVGILQSALAGQTKPARRLGADITQSTLQLTLDTNGIDKAVSDLSYAEKRLLIVASITQQTNESWGDWGRTIESVANQMRIFQQQTERLTRALGNVFLPILKRILPYLNAILMVLTEIIKWIATLVGYNKEEFDFFGSDDAIIDFGDDIANLGDELDKTNEKAKKLQNGLRSFDKLNNIKTPTTSGKTNGGAGGMGVSADILDLFNKTSDSYLNSLKDVEMKATDIRDRIMEWLGFTKEINSETGEVSFKFDHITGGTVLGALAVGGVIYSGVHKIYKILKKMGLLEFPFVSGLLKLIKLDGVFEAFGVGFELISAGEASIGSVITELILPAIGEFAIALGGVLLVIGGIVRIFQGINDLLDDTKSKFDGIIKIIEGIALVVAGVAVLLGAWPVALVAAIVAALAFITELVVNNWDKISEFFVNIWDKLYGTVIKPIVDFISTIATFIYDFAIKPVIDFFKPIIEAIWKVLSYALEKTWEIVKGVGLAIWSIIEKIWEIFKKIIEIFIALGKAVWDYVIKPVLDYIGQIFKWIYDKVIKPVIDIFVKAGTWVYDHVIKPIWEKILWIRDKVVDVFKKIGTTVVDFISGLFKSVINGIFATIESGINFFIKMLNSAINLINKIPGVDISKVDLLKIPRLKVGMDFVPNDNYPAYLDYGERVLTKEENEDYSKGIINGQNAISGQPLNATFIIQVGSEEIAKTVLNDLQDMAKSNGKPITIGG